MSARDGVLDDTIADLSDIVDVLGRLLADSGEGLDDKQRDALVGIAAALERSLDEQRPHPYDDDPFPLG